MALQEQGRPKSPSQWSEETGRILDQLAYRFGKLQDSLGERVLPDIPTLAEEPLTPDTTFAQKLQRLERPGGCRIMGIESVQTWRGLLAMRNALSHEYPNHPTLQGALLRRFLEAVTEFLQVCRDVRHYVERGWPGLIAPRTGE